MKHYASGIAAQLKSNIGFPRYLFLIEKLPWSEIHYWMQIKCSEYYPMKQNEMTLKATLWLRRGFIRQGSIPSNLRRWAARFAMWHEHGARAHPPCSQGKLNLANVIYLTDSRKPCNKYPVRRQIKKSYAWVSLKTYCFMSNIQFQDSTGNSTWNKRIIKKIK